MSDLIPRLTDTIDAIRADRATRLPREVVRAVHREHGRGLVAAARLNAGAYAARTGLINTAMLSKDEEQFITMAPLGEARYKAIVDAYAIYAAGEIASFPGAGGRL